MFLIFFFCCRYDRTTGIFRVPPGGDGVYYFSTYLLSFGGEYGRFDMRLNDDVICTAFEDHSNNGSGDAAPGSCTAVVDVIAGNYFSLDTSKVLSNHLSQESPPAWTQEAYRPPCSEYSVVLPGYPPPGGYLTRAPPGGSGYPPGGYLTRVPPWGGSRYPPGGVPDPGTPPGGSGYPPGGGYLTGYPPASWHSGKCCKALWDMGTPPVDRQIDGWTDACQNITFPRTTYAGGNNVCKEKHGKRTHELNSLNLVLCFVDFQLMKLRSF